MKVWTFHITVHVPADTETEAWKIFDAAGLSDGPMTFVQDGRKFDAFYVNVDGVDPEYEITHSYDTEDLWTRWARP